MSKKVLSLALALIFALGMFSFLAFAADPISVTLDGRALTFDVPPQLINDRTMVPLRAIFEAMGAKVDWDGDTETVTGTKDDTVVILAIGSASPTINGRVVTIDQPGVIIDGRTLAPLRFVAEAFGGTVDWDGNTQTASISMGGTAATTPPATTQPPAATPPATTTPTSTPPATPSEPTPTPSGNIDAKIVGEWSYNDITLHSNEHHNYFFYENGTAEFFITGGMMYHGDAKYSISDGKIYLAEFYETGGRGVREMRKDKIVEYSIGSDEKGEYLNIGNIPGWSDYAENRPMKFRK